MSNSVTNSNSMSGKNSNLIPNDNDDDYVNASSISSKGSNEEVSGED